MPKVVAVDDIKATRIQRADVPEAWRCPDCSATKGDFEMVEL